jgi:serine carboxypeptidase-like clade 1
MTVFVSAVVTVVSFLFVFLVNTVVEGAVPADEITSLPEFSGSLPSKQYSGYLQVAQTTFLHYWFVESENNPTTDPVVLWLNGGPGCSSLDGFFYELGPFELKAGGGLKLRPYRWNRFANMLFLEAPVGVGFSYSSDKDYSNSDNRTATENMLAIEKFFESYSEYKSNGLYLTGESYAGIYVPTLAEAILKSTDAGTYTGASLLGIAVGNGCTGYETGVCGWYFGGVCEGFYYEYQYLIELPFLRQSLKDEIASACDWSTCKNNRTMDSYLHSLSHECLGLLDRASVELGAINVYNVYGTCIFDACDGPLENADKIGRVHHLQTHLDKFNKLKSKVQAVQNGKTNSPDHRSTLTSRLSITGETHREIGVSDVGVNTDDFMNITDDTVRGPVGCIDSALATDYLMQPRVQAAIHVKDPGYCWASCNQVANWTYTANRPNLPRDTYPFLISRLHVLIYNGDWDACVPYTDNAAWTENMGLPITTPWQRWYYQAADNTTQIGGYTVSYNVSSLESAKGSGRSSFEFRTVRGAGHMVPTDQPLQGLALLARLLGVPSSMYYFPATEANTDDDMTMDCPSPTGNRSMIQFIVFFFIFCVLGLACLYLYREVTRLKLAVESSNRDVGSWAPGQARAGPKATNPMYVGVSVNENL